MATEETSLDVDSELVWVKVRFVGRNPLYICSFYSVPNSSTEPLFQLVRESMLKLYSERTLPDTVLAGDVNLPDMDWENGYVNPSPIHGHEVNQVMLDIANDYGLCHYSNINITIVAQLSTEDVNMLIFKRSIATNLTGGMYFRPSWCSCPSNFSCPCFGQFNVALACLCIIHSSRNRSDPAHSMLPTAMCSECCSR